MSVVLDGFSIREFTAKMRVADAVKCWPFGGGDDDDNDDSSAKVNKEQVEALLPSITVTKFRWWSHHDSKQQQQQPDDVLLERPRQFVAAAIKEEEKRKAKSKAPKKRSILEIFAVSPQIANNKENDDHAKKKKKKKKMMKVKINGNSKIRKKVKNNFMLDKHQKYNKEKSRSRKLSSSVHCHSKLNDTTSNKQLAIEVWQEVPMDENEPNLRSFMKKKHDKLKSSGNKVKEALHVRGILKNSISTGTQESSSVCMLPDATQGNIGEVQQFDKRVRFSDKEDIINPGRESLPLSEENICNKCQDAFASQSELNHSPMNDQQLAGTEANSDDSESLVRREQSSFHQPISQKQQPGFHVHIHQMTSSLDTDVASQEEYSPRTQVAIHEYNEPVFEQEFHTTQTNPTYAGISRVLPTAKELHSPHVNSPFRDSVSRASGSRENFVEYLEGRPHEHSSMVVSARELSQPSSPNFPLTLGADRRVSFMAETSVNNITGQTSPHRQVCHVSPAEMRGSGWRERVVSFSERRFDNEYYGLPLNSQGELIQMRSGARDGIGMNKSTVISSGSLPTYNTIQTGILENLNKKQTFERVATKDQSYSIPMESFSRVQLPARLGVTDFSSAAGEDLPSLNFNRESKRMIHPYDSCLNLMSIPAGHCRQYNQDHNEKRHGTSFRLGNTAKGTQSTMRLMGKDLAIFGRDSEMPMSEDGKIWMDKEVIEEHHCTSSDCVTSLTNTGMEEDGRHMLVGKSFCQPLEVQSNAFQRNVQMKAPESRFPLPVFNGRANSVFDIGASSESQQRIAFRSPTSAIPYKAANTQEPFSVMSASLSMHPYFEMRPMDINHKQNRPQAATRTLYDFPFLEPDCAKQARSPSFSSSNLPPWLARSTVQVEAATTRGVLPNELGSHHYHHQTTPAYDYLPIPPSHARPVVYSHNPTMSDIHPENPFDCAAYIHPSFISCGAEMGTNNANYKMKSKAFDVGPSDSCIRTKKRPAVALTDSWRHAKIPSLMQKGLSSVEELREEELSRRMWHTSELHNLHLDSNTPTGLCCGPLCPSKNDFRTLHGNIGESTEYSGPVKLSAGAKHILKPTHNMDQESSKLVHSTVPYSVTSHGTFVNSQKKSTKIYMF